MASRRARVAPHAERSRKAGGQSRGRSAATRRNPLLLLAIAAGTVIVLGVILTIALVRGSNVATGTPTAVASPGATPSSGPVALPQPSIGAVDRSSGATQVAIAPKPGQPAPDFTWYTTNGRTTLSALRGHAVLLEFFGVWCPACQSDTALLND